MAVIVCPNCQFSNPHGALFCQKCGTMLIDTVHMLKTDALKSKPLSQQPDTEALRYMRRTEARKLTNPFSIALYVGTASLPLILLLTKSAILGRGAPKDEQMRVDLSPYNATENGVSRQHVILKRAEASTLMVEDMGSSNGTWLNDTLLQPFRAAKIVSGDELRLGKLLVSIFLP